MAGHKAVRIAQVAQPLVTEKQGMPQTKTRRTISISTLFGQQAQLKRKVEKDAQDILAPTPAGISKPYAQSRHPRGHENPVYRKFLDVTKNYRNSSGQGSAEQLELVFKDLVARIDDLAVPGDVEGTDARVSDARDAAPAEQYDQLAKPMGEDQITLQRTRPDGSTVAVERKLADSMKIFERVLEQKRHEMEQLLHELKIVDADVAAVKEDIHLVEQRAAKKLKRNLDGQVASLVQRVYSSKEDTLADIRKARKAEKAATEAQNKAFDRFLETV